MNGDTWFTSDSHFGHRNIVYGISEWTDKSACRGFDTLEEHDEAVIEGINKYVKPNDQLRHMGDWSFGGRENVYTYRQKVNCNNIHFTLGNHDHHIGNDRVVSEINLKSLFRSVEKVSQYKYGSYEFVLSHYAMRTWDKAHHGTIMLYGHSHGALPEYQETSTENDVLIPTGNLYKTMDVGVDVAFNMFGEYRPFHISEIIEIMNKRVNLGSTSKRI